MKTVSMSGSLRENVGKKDAKALRREEKVPCVLYGAGNQVQFSVDQKAFKPLLFTPEASYVQLDIAGKTYMAILQDIQYHPVTDEVLHADFIELQESKPIIMGIPVAVVGDSPGVIKGGKLIFKFRKLKVQALPSQMPEKITLDISSLEIGQGIEVQEITLENYEILEGKTSFVVFVKPTRGTTK